MFRQHDLVSIGAHVYGGALNSASVIGKYGNPYGDYIAAFGLPLGNDGLNLIPVTGNGSQTQSGPRHKRGSTMTNLIQNGGVTQARNGKARSPRTEAEEEGFMDVLRTVASALPTGLGIVGGPIGALAGFALNAASNLTAESVAAESVLDESTINEGSMERAILAEATLSALQSAELHPDLEESIFDDIKDTVMKALPVIRKAAPHVMGAMMEPALKIALDSLHNYNQRSAAGAESFEATTSEPFRPTVVYSPDIDNRADHQTEAFLDYLQASLRQNIQESAMDRDSEENFIDVIKAGARFGKGVLAAVKHGLPIIVDAMAHSEGAESLEDEPSSGRLLAAGPLAQRALVADAALKAVMSIPPKQLQEEEGFFSSIADAIKKIAPIAMKVAPVIAKAINPTVGKIVKSVLSPESTSTDDSTVRGSTAPRRGGNRDLSSKRSLHVLRGGNTHGDGKSRRFEQPATDGSRNGNQSRLA